MALVVRTAAQREAPTAGAVAAAWRMACARVASAAHRLHFARSPRSKRLQGPLFPLGKPQGSTTPWAVAAWRSLATAVAGALPVVCTFSWSHRLRFSEDLKQSGSQHRNKKLSIRGRDRPGPASRLYSRPKATAPLPTQNSSNRLLRDWCWLWCWCWCFLLLVVLDAVLARYRMQMTMT